MPGYGDAYTVTTSDTVALPKEADSIFVGAAGNVTVITDNEWNRVNVANPAMTIAQKITAATKVSFNAVVAGTTIPLRCAVVMATGTTSTSVTALVAI
jgi:hypothetical protein